MLRFVFRDVLSTSISSSESPTKPILKKRKNQEHQALTTMNVSIVSPPKSVRFREFNGWKTIRMLSYGSFAQVWLININKTHRYQQQNENQAALKIFNGLKAKRNKFECEKEKAIVHNIAMNPFGTGMFVCML